MPNWLLDNWILFLFVILVLLILFVFFTTCKKEKFCTELKANDDLWENENVIRYNNCYAYAFADIDSNRKGKPQPGFKVDLEPLSRNNYTCGKIINRVLLDHPGTIYLGDNPTIADQRCPCNNHMVYLALDNTGDSRDYHFYRQNADGFWTHKPGSTEVLHTDASGQMIVNPALADRHYPDFDYSTSCGFFCTKTTDLIGSGPA